MLSQSSLLHQLSQLSFTFVKFIYSCLHWLVATELYLFIYFLLVYSDYNGWWHHWVSQAKSLVRSGCSLARRCLATPWEDRAMGKNDGPAVAAETRRRPQTLGELAPNTPPQKTGSSSAQPAPSQDHSTPEHASQNTKKVSPSGSECLFTSRKNKPSFVDERAWSGIVASKTCHNLLHCILLIASRLYSTVLCK